MTFNVQDITRSESGCLSMTCGSVPQTQRLASAVSGSESAAPHCCALRCWACGKTVEITTAGPPQFAFEIAGWAKDVGWVGVIDMEHSRSMVFCSQKCVDSAKTKRGTFRLRPQRNAANEPRGE